MIRTFNTSLLFTHKFVIKQQFSRSHTSRAETLLFQHDHPNIILGVRPNRIKSRNCHRYSSTSIKGTLFEEVCSIKISVFDVPGTYAEEISDILLAEGATSTAIEEHRPAGAPEQKIFAHDGNTTTSSSQVWDRCIVIAYFPPEVHTLLHTRFQHTILPNFYLFTECYYFLTTRTEL